MKKIHKLLGIAAMSFCVISCVEEMGSPVSQSLKEMEFITISDPDVKSYLNSDLSISWQAGDLAGVYDGTAWREFQAQSEGTSTVLKGEALETSSYTALFPYDSKASMTGGKIKTSFPAVQTLSGKSVAQNALLAVATSQNQNFAFKNVISLLKMTLAESDQIVRVELSSRGDESLCGEITITPSNEPTYTLENGGSVVSLVRADNEVLSGECFMTVLPQNFTDGIQLAFYNKAGQKAVKKYGAMEFIRNSGKDAKEIRNLDWKNNLQARNIAATSSTLAFEWTEHDYNDPAADQNHPYTIALYKDKDCSDLVVSWNIDKASACLNGKQPRFVFSGLAQSTPYWFKVTDTENAAVSETVEARTTAFTVKEVSGTASEGDVVLAEDFSELVWGTEEYNAAAGYTTLNNNAEAMIPAAGENPTDSYKTIKAGDYSALFTTFKNSVKNTRLASWGAICYNSDQLLGESKKVIGRAGHIMLNTWSGGTASLVTPALTSLSGMAKLRVSFKVAKYNKDDSNANSVGIFMLDANSTLSDANVVTFASRTCLKTVDITTTMTEYTAEIDDVASGCRLAIGPVSTAGSKARIYLDDIKVELLKYTTYPIDARLVTSSSATATFTWSENDYNDLEADLANNYTIGIYNDQNCTDAVVTWNTDAATFTYKTDIRYQPCFVFTGLAQNTTYWFRVHDTTNNTYSNTVSVTTDKFTVKEPDTTPVAAGGVLLAEDFSGLVWGSDEINYATGYESRTFGTDKYMTAATGNSPLDVYRYMPYGDYHSMHYWYKEPLRTSRYRDWSYLSYFNKNLQNDGTSDADTQWDKKINARAGYVLLGTWNNGNGIIVTPPLTNLSSTAKVKVSFKGARYSTSDHNGITAYKIEPGAQVYETNLGLKDPQVTMGVKQWLHNDNEIVGVSGPALWKSFSVDLTDVKPGSRIGVGPCNKSGKGERMYVDDIVITVVSYNE